MTVGVVDYGAGNSVSVCNALRYLGCEVVVSSDPERLRLTNHLVLPGVGHFGAAMRELTSTGLAELLSEATPDGSRRLLGICLGFQLLFEGSAESPDSPGLGLLDGRVEHLSAMAECAVPRVGFATVHATAAGGNTPLDGRDFYFCHSYAVAESAHASSVTLDGAVVASVRVGRLEAFQFHPEKSQTNGLGLLRNWLERGSG